MVIGAEGVAPCGSGSVVAGASCTVAERCCEEGLSPEGAWTEVDSPDVCVGAAVEAAAAEEWAVADFFLEEPVEECLVEEPDCFFEEPPADEEELLEEFLEEFLELLEELLEALFFLEDEEWDDLEEEDLPEEEAELP